MVWFSGGLSDFETCSESRFGVRLLMLPVFVSEFCKTNSGCPKFIFTTARLDSEPFFGGQDSR